MRLGRLLPLLVALLLVSCFSAQAAPPAPGRPDSQAQTGLEPPSGPPKPVVSSPPTSLAGSASDDVPGVFRIPPAEPARAAEPEMAQAVPRGDTDEVAPRHASPGTSLGETTPSSVQLDPASAPGPAPSSPAPLVSFPGVTYTGWIPPDDQIAAGPDHLVIPLNGAVAYYDKAGNNLFQTTLTNFWGSLADPVDYVFDPRVIWDHYLGRFVLVATGLNDLPEQSYYFISVSETSDPFDGWCMRRLDATTDGGNPSNNWADYPDVGVDSEAIYVSSNQFAFSGGFQYAKLRIMDRNAFIGAGCAGAISWWDFWNFQDEDGGTVFTLRPSATHGPTSGEYVANANDGPGDFLTLWRVTNPLSPGPDPPTVERVTLAVDPYSTPPDALQPGGVQPLDNVGTRLLNVVSYDDRLWTVGTTDCSGWSCIRWYQLDLSSWPTVTIDHQGDFGEPGSNDYFYPGIAANTTQDVVISFARSGPATFAEARYTGRLATGPQNSLQPSALLKAGEDTYLILDHIDRNRWGDYAGVSYGANDEFWVLHQYADDPNHWDTWVGRVDFGPSCDPGVDTDGDGFDDDVECHLGTDPLDDCPDSVAAESGAQCGNGLDDDGDTRVDDGCPPVGPAESGSECENAVDDDADTVVNDGCPPFDGDDAWPPDIYIDRTADILDVLLFKGKLNYCESEPEFDPRHDLYAAPSPVCSPPELRVDILDVLLYKPVLNTSCTNP